MESDIDAAARFEVNQFMFECAGSIIGLSLTDHQKHTLFHRFKKVLEDAEYKIKQARESALDTHANAAVLKMCHEARMMNGIVDYSDPKAVGVVRRVLGDLPVSIDGMVIGTDARVYWTNGAGYIHGIITQDLLACVYGLRLPPSGLHGSREAAEAAKEAGK